MELPVIETPIFPRWVWIEEITYSHIPIATLITAFMVLAPIYEYVGWRRGDARYDRLARGLIWFALILFSPGAALGTGIPVFIIGTYPEFWSRWSNLFFWPLIAQFVFFTLEVGFLFFGYYLSWDRLAKRKALHITLGCIAMLWGLMVQFVWDALGGYMLTPGGVDLPAVKEPVGWSAAAFFNPSLPFLFSHRFFGNISYAMLLVGGVLALRYMKQKDPKEKAYFAWASNLTFTVGFVAFFAMPAIGWFYARVIEAEAPVAFQSIMGGHQGTIFTIKFTLIATMLLLGGAYLGGRYKSKMLLGIITAGLAGLIVVLNLHPPLTWFGERPLLYRAAGTGAIAAIGGLAWLAHLRLNREGRPWPVPMFIAGLAASFAFALGGFVREASKGPMTVYGEIEKPEATEAEKDRFLVYDTCMGCHHADEGPPMLKRARGSDWAEMMRIHREREEERLEISEEKAQRIVAAFEEAQAKGLGVVSLGSKMIDPPVVKRAQRVVRLAQAMGLAS
jgi:cytochrome bd-type quinol oxidase subunit 1